MAGLTGKKVAFLVANEGVEQVELTDPWQAVEGAGGTPVLIAPDTGDVQAFNHLDRGDVFDASVASADARVDDYAGLVLPGGVANPDQLRTDAPAVALTMAFLEAGKPVAAICHGPWTLIEAGVVVGRELTSWPSLRTDIENAGAAWVDQPVKVCNCGPGVLVTSRNPDDLPGFNQAIIEAFAD